MSFTFCNAHKYARHVVLRLFVTAEWMLTKRTNRWIWNDSFVLEHSYRMHLFYVVFTAFVLLCRLHFQFNVLLLWFWIIEFRLHICAQLILIHMPERIWIERMELWEIATIHLHWMRRDENKKRADEMHKEMKKSSAKEGTKMIRKNQMHREKCEKNRNSGTSSLK